ncbi:MAG: hypothetical protein ACR2JI_05990 [Mycobacterium sp.]
MSSTFTRIVTALTGPALAAGILAAAIAGAGSAQAQVVGSQTQNCITSTGVGSAKAGAPDPMTRAGQLNVSAPSAATAPTSCISH